MQAHGILRIVIHLGCHQSQQGRCVYIDALAELHHHCAVSIEVGIYTHDALQSRSICIPALLPSICPINRR